MWRMGSARVWLAVALMLGAGGCFLAHLPSAAPEPPIAVVVDSHNDATFDVFAIIGDGDARRLGMLMGFSKVTFTLPREAAARGSVRIVAVPIGGFGAANSGPLTVQGGDTVVFTVQQVLSSSFAVVR